MHSQIESLLVHLRSLSEANWKDWANDINVDAQEYGFKHQRVHTHDDGAKTHIYQHPETGHMLYISAGHMPSWTMTDKHGGIVDQSRSDHHHRDMFLDRAARYAGLKHGILKGSPNLLHSYESIDYAVMLVANGRSPQRVLESVMTTIHHDFYGNRAGINNRIPVCPSCGMTVAGLGHACKRVGESSVKENHYDYHAGKSISHPIVRKDAMGRHYYYVGMSNKSVPEYRHHDGKRLYVKSGSFGTPVKATSYEHQSELMNHTGIDHPGFWAQNG